MGFFFERALCSFEDEIQTRNFTIYYFNEVKYKFFFFHNWINKLFSEENNVLKTLFEAREVAGSGKYKQSKTVWNCVVL